MSMTLPEELKKLYLTNNGQVSCNKFEGFFYGLRFYTLEELYESWKVNASICKGLSEEDMAKQCERNSSYPENAVKKHYLNVNWIPFATDTCGNFIGVDLDPDIQGTRGQIIIFGRDEMEKVVVANSLHEYITFMIEQLKKRNYRFEKIKRFSSEGDKIIFSYKEDKHPNDVLKKIIKGLF